MLQVGVQGMVEGSFLMIATAIGLQVLGISSNEYYKQHAGRLGLDLDFLQTPCLLAWRLAAVKLNESQRKQRYEKTCTGTYILHKVTAHPVPHLLASAAV